MNAAEEKYQREILNALMDYMLDLHIRIRKMELELTYLLLETKGTEIDNPFPNAGHLNLIQNQLEEKFKTDLLQRIPGLKWNDIKR